MRAPKSPARSGSALSLPAFSISVDWPPHHHPPGPGHGASFLSLAFGSSSCLCAGRGPGLVGQHSPTLLPSRLHPDLLCLTCNLTGESLTCNFVPAGGPLDRRCRGRAPDGGPHRAVGFLVPRRGGVGEAGSAGRLCGTCPSLRAGGPWTLRFRVLSALRWVRAAGAPAGPGAAGP